jgi:ankyrin repeat protein
MANTSELDRGLPTPSFYWNYRHMAHRRNDSDTVILPASSSISLPALPQLQAQNLSLQEPIVPKRSSYSYSENIPSSKSWKSSFRRSSSHNPAFPSAGMMDRTTTLDTDYLSVPSTATSSSEPATPNGRVRRRSILKTLFSTTNHMPSSLPCGSPGVVVSTSNMQGPSQRQSGIVPLRNLGLHQGAATGNIGLVKFALDLGQPVNSVLNGVLPIHVACCSGSVQTVQMLLDHGADVNARR